MKDIRWQQNLDNYSKAVETLGRTLAITKERTLTETEQLGLIQAFELTHETAWKCLKNYFEYQGIVDITGSRDATRQAFKNNLIDSADGDVWMEMIVSRNNTSHTYNKATADDISAKIINSYATLFLKLLTKFESLKKNG